jgi:hypothetical protein
VGAGEGRCVGAAVVGDCEGGKDVGSAEGIALGRVDGETILGEPDLHHAPLSRESLRHSHKSDSVSGPATYVGIAVLGIPVLGVAELGDALLHPTQSMVSHPGFASAFHKLRSIELHTTSR